MGETDTPELAGSPMTSPSWWPLTTNPRAAGRARRLGWLVGLLCAAWLVPLVAHQSRLDVVQPVLLLVAVASILRSGTNLVDRFMLAAGLLAGAALALGLALSIWPWGLHPVPVAGTCFSLVVMIGWLSRRPPRLPRRMLGSDVVVLGSGIFAFLAAYAPVARMPAVQRFMLSTTAEDRFAHFALFDTIRRLGGYTFLHQRAAIVSVEHPTEIVYPSGSHFLYALFDTFLKSTTGPGTPVQEFNRYFIYVLLAYGFLIMSLVWAARWIAGPLVRGWLKFFICTAVAALALSGPLLMMVKDGFDSEIAGLAFLALAVAATVRPTRVVREQVLIVCALLVAVAYAYNLYAPMAALGMAAACVIYRRRLRRHWLFTIVTVIAGCAIAFYPSALSLLSGFNAQAQLLARGTALPPALPLLEVLAVMIVATMASSVARRLPACRAMAIQVVIAGLVIAAVGAYQVASRGNISYYCDKLLMAGYVVCLAGLGAVGILLRRLPAWPGGRPSLLREAPAAVIAGAAALSLAVVAQWGLDPASTGPVYPPATPLGTWNAGRMEAPEGPSLVALADAHLLGDHVPILVFYTNSGLENWRDSFLAAAFNRDVGVLRNPINEILFAAVGGPPINAHATRAGLGRVLRALRESPLPMRLVVWNPALAHKLEAMLAAHPDVHATVMVLPTLRT
jgi:hypothetical protein